MNITINKQYEKGVLIARAGTGMESIDVPFVPDFVRVRLEGPQLTKKGDIAGQDEVYWNLVKIATGYRLDIGWSVYTSRREIHYQVAALQIDPM